MTDLQFFNATSFALCTPMTQAGEEWLQENIADACAIGESIPIEFRFLEAIVIGARADGIACEG